MNEDAITIEIAQAENIDEIVSPSHFHLMPIANNTSTLYILL